MLVDKVDMIIVIRHAELNEEGRRVNLSEVTPYHFPLSNTPLVTANIVAVHGNRTIRIIKSREPSIPVEIVDKIMKLVRVDDACGWHPTMFDMENVFA
jgi:hypothetical protein